MAFETAGLGDLDVLVVMHAHIDKSLDGPELMLPPCLVQETVCGSPCRRLSRVTIPATWLTYTPDFPYVKRRSDMKLFLWFSCSFQLFVHKLKGCLNPQTEPAHLDVRQGSQKVTQAVVAHRRPSTLKGHCLPFDRYLEVVHGSSFV